MKVYIRSMLVGFVLFGILIIGIQMEFREMYYKDPGNMVSIQLNNSEDLVELHEVTFQGAIHWKESRQGYLYFLDGKKVPIEISRDGKYFAFDPEGEEVYTFELSVEFDK